MFFVNLFLDLKKIGQIFGLQLFVPGRWLNAQIFKTYLKKLKII